MLPLVYAKLMLEQCIEAYLNKRLSAASPVFQLHHESVHLHSSVKLPQCSLSCSPAPP
eukprot:c2255_g1_i1 orf=1-171(-)